jgi:NADH-quinone oxidoreductase subunit I
MERPPHPMYLGDSDKDYYIGALTNPGTSAGAERAAWSDAGTSDAAVTTGDPAPSSDRAETAGTARRADAKNEAVSSGLTREKGGAR